MGLSNNQPSCVASKNLNAVSNPGVGGTIELAPRYLEQVYVVGCAKWFTVRAVVTTPEIASVMAQKI
ncbi:hypothetical protein C5167_036067 [Papaver somniferum]|nr:hypothetical protein C5167_036067 [Papaver somniferum]